MPTGGIIIAIFIAFLYGMKFNEDPKAFMIVVVLGVIGWFLYEVIYGRHD